MMTVLLTVAYGRGAGHEAVVGGQARSQRALKRGRILACGLSKCHKRSSNPPPTAPRKGSSRRQMEAEAPTPRRPARAHKGKLTSQATQNRAARAQVAHLSIAEASAAVRQGTGGGADEVWV